MSDKESKFVDTNPENQKPHNISGKNPRSVQTLHKSQVKPRSQDKEINIEIVENEDTVYKTKTTYLVQKAKMQLKRRVAPGVSEIIIRKNEEKRKLAEAKAEEEAKARAEAEKAEKEELETKVQKEIEKQDEKIAQRKGINEEKEEVSEEPAEVYVHGLCNLGSIGIQLFVDGIRGEDCLSILQDANTEFFPEIRIFP